MKRIIDIHLLAWKRSSIRKPILLRGARQVGKTFAVRTLAKSFSSYVEINFEKQPALIKIFDIDLDPVRIVRDLKAILKKDIIPGKTLLFFDEIQEAPQAIIALRYFYEEMPKLHVLAAGSLLDFAIQKVGVPVGRVSFLYLYPLSFIEFLIAQGQEQIVEAILNHDPLIPMAEPIHSHILRILSEYFAIGGMPEAVASWVKNKDPLMCSKIHHTIIDAYRQDFTKYANEHQIKYVELLFEKGVQQLGRKFKFSNISSEYRKRELSPALDLLCTARVIQKIYHTSGQGIPLGAEVNLEKFKLIFVDIGLTQVMLGLDLADWFLHASDNFVNQGSLVEAFVGQELLAYSDPNIKAALYYWHNEERGRQAEVDYLIQKGGKVVPIEVKSHQGIQLKSMRLFLASHLKSSDGIRFSSHDYSVYDNIFSYPLYAISAALGFSETSVLQK